jgi:NAD(P)-dependent dehydrogenase (short-subunit alcohol dehydrogenase family)
MSNPFDMADRVAIVTGAGRGIGREIARVLSEAGARVAIAEIDKDTGAEAASELRSAGREAIAVEVDVAEPTSALHMAEEVLAEFERIDILVNNAGIGGTNRPQLADDPADWQRVLRVNLDGVLWRCRAVAPTMIEQGAGSIVNIASMSGLIVNTPQPQADYNASKAAVIHLTRSLATEWAGDGVRVNSVSPGYVATELTQAGAGRPSSWLDAWVSLTPMKRMGTPREVANAVWFLASDAASFCTGTNLVVDGGYTSW